MTICTIYHSYTGITRNVAKQIHAVCGGDIIEIKPREPYSKLTAFTLGCYRARNESCDPVEPEEVNVTSCSLIVIGTPVWAWKATPVINGAIAALQGCEGKKAVIFATCGSAANETLSILKTKLEAKGVAVQAEAVLSKKDIDEGEKIKDLIATVRAKDIESTQST